MASILNRKFWINKSFIEKKENQKTAYYIQVYNNRVIDKFIKDYSEDNPLAKPSQATLYAELWVLNKPHVYAQYNRIINSKYTSNTALFEMLMKDRANGRLNVVVEAELERITKNLNYTEKVLNTHELNLKEYQKIARRESKIANRKDIMERSVKDIDFMRSKFGINIQPNVFSYKDLENTAEALNRQTQMGATWDEYDAINQKALEDGGNEIYTQKEWIWTGEGMTTRHESNDGQIVSFNDTFTIVNDATGDVDELMYPCDPNGSFSNAGICYCQMRAF